MESKKIQQISECNKKKTDTDIENKFVVTSGEKGGQYTGRGLRDANYSI